MAKLVALFFLLPTLFSIWAQKEFISSSKCYVGPFDASFQDIENDFFGVWIASSKPMMTMMKCRMQHPSTTQRDQMGNKRYPYPEWDCEDEFTTQFNDQTNVWCFIHRESQTTFCKDNGSTGLDQVVGGSQLSSGIYSSQSNPNQKLSVSCSQGLDPFNRKYMQRDPSQELFPSTTLLLLLNIGLAYIYWDKRVDPFSVCKHYNKIVHDMEIWRSFTGALAHFEPLHLAFNMMSLHALGTALEPRYGSFAFLQYNICMIPLTTIIMLILIRLRIRYTGNHQHSETSSVGFSGVLFAWMVVTSLESYAVCPIPFAPEMCFNTHEYGVGILKLKFNWGPFIQLLFAQVIMPRVSFIGHLAGIICGFIFHWRILPTFIFWSPQVLIPLIIVLHWRYVRNIDYLSDVDDPSIELDQIHSSSKVNETKLLHRRLRMTLLVMNLIGLISLILFGVMASMSLSQLLCSYIFFLAVRQHRNSNQLVPNANQILLWRGVIISLIIAILCDAFLVPMWIFTQLSIYGNSIMRMEALMDPLVMSIRWMVNFIALIQASMIHSDIGQSENEPRIFSKVFGKIVQWCSETNRIFPEQRSPFIPFGGSGNVLGGSGNGNSARTRMIVDL